MSAFDPYPESLAALVEKLDVQPAADNKELTNRAHTILLAVKPQYITTSIRQPSHLPRRNHAGGPDSTDRTWI